MDDFTSSNNFGIIKIACRNMISDKFNLDIEDNEISDILNDVIETMKEEFSTESLKTNELNNIVLSRVKDLLTFQSNNSNQDDSTTNDEKLDDDMINIKLRELESRRQIIPEFTPNIIDNTKTNFEHSSIAKPNPISITLPKHKTETYKTLIINSINRDWVKQPLRNNIKFSMSQDLHLNIFYPHCILLPKFVRNITPYVLLHISDGERTVYYSFTCENDSCGSWNKWVTVENPENISLNTKIWSIKMFDFANNELNLGKDFCQIIQVQTLDETKFELTCDNNINGNMICIRMKNGKNVYKNIKETDNKNVFILEKEDFIESDFINAVVLDVTEQYSFIMKYCYK